MAPSKRAVRIARKVLASDPVVPARMTDVMRDTMWTLQWSELRVLALAVKNAEDPTMRKRKKARR